MKTYLCFFFGLLAPMQLLAQSSKVLEEGPHHRRVETVTTGYDEQGTLITETNSIIQLQAGLNVWSEAEQNWIPASDEIELLNGGVDGAIAQKAQHTVLFPVRLTSTNGGILVRMPDGKEMHARVVGLVITDSLNPSKKVSVNGIDIFLREVARCGVARKLRVEYPGAIYHVMNRGDRREPIFRDDEDRQRFLATLGEACMKTGWTVHAYCLMSNHSHQKVSVWIAQRLCMGARGHLTHLLYWHGRDQPPPPKTPRAKHDKTID